VFKEAKLSDFSESFIKQVEDFPQSINLLLISSPGAGKTHYARAIQQTYGGLYFLISQFFREIRAVDSKEQNRLIENAIYEPILIWDDFGIEKGTEFEIGVMHEILERRIWENPTGFLILSNATPSQILETYGAKIWDRIFANFKILFFKGKSKRIFTLDEKEMQILIVKNLEKKENKKNKKELIPDDIKNIINYYKTLKAEVVNGKI